MRKHTKENGLVMYEDNIFAKVKRFFLKKIWRQNNAEGTYERDYPGTKERIEVANGEVKKKRALYNFDAEDDEIVKNKNFSTGENTENFMEIDNFVRKEGENSIYNAPIAQDVENQEVEENYIGMAKKELTVEEEKEELERKLMRYYESIKDIANMSM